MADQVHQRAVGAVLKQALFRWESAVTVALTAILFLFVQNPFPWWQDWFWLVGGALAEVALVVSALTDEQANIEAINKEFEAKYDLRQIKNRVARERLERALEYRRNMLALVKRHSGAMRINLQQTVNDVNEWISHMYDLAQHLDAFEDNELVERDRQAVPQQIRSAQERLKVEKDPTVQKDLQDQVNQLQQQLTNLEATANSAKRAEIQLESTLSSLGTIFAQMSLLGTKEVDSGRAQRLRLEIQDEVSSLQDTIEAMNEVQAQKLRLR